MAAGRSLPPPSPASAAAEHAHKATPPGMSLLQSVWETQRGAPQPSTVPTPLPQPTAAAQLDSSALSMRSAAAASASPELRLVADTFMPLGNRSSQASTAWDSHDVSESGMQSPISSRLSTPASPTASHATAGTLSIDAAIDPWPRPPSTKPQQGTLAPAEASAPETPLSAMASPSVPPHQPALQVPQPPLPGNSPAVASTGLGLFPSLLQQPLGSSSMGSIWDRPGGSLLSGADWSGNGPLWGADLAVAPAAPDPWAPLPQTQSSVDSTAPALPDTLFADPWAGQHRPDVNPWSLGGSALLSELPEAPTSSGQADIADAAWRMSQLNPSALEFTAPTASSATEPAAVQQQRQSIQPPIQASLQAGSSHGEASLLAEPSQGCGSIWAAPGGGLGPPAAGAAASLGDGSWDSASQAFRSNAAAAAPPVNLSWDDGVAQQFPDAPGFLDSLMQQVLPEDELSRGPPLSPRQPSPSLLHLQSSLYMQQQLQYHHHQQQQQQQPAMLGGFGQDPSTAGRLLGAANLQLGSLFTLPPLSQQPQAHPSDWSFMGTAQAQQQWQQQAMVPQNHAFSMGNASPLQQGVAAAQLPSASISRAARGSSGSGMPHVAAGSQPQGSVFFRRAPASGPPPGYGQQGGTADSGFAAPASRPSDVVHAFAQVVFNFFSLSKITICGLGQDRTTRQLLSVVFGCGGICRCVTFTS